MRLIRHGVVRSSPEELKAGMARRRIGQERLAVGVAQVSKGASLDEVAALVDWSMRYRSTTTSGAARLSEEVEDGDQDAKGRIDLIHERLKRLRERLR